MNVVAYLLELGGGEEFVTRWSVIAQVAGRSHWITLDAMNRWRYAAFYLAGGVVSMLPQIAADPTSQVPCLGASGAIAAVMGVFLVTYPRDRIRTVVFLGWLARVTFVPVAARLFEDPRRRAA